MNEIVYLMCKYAGVPVGKLLRLTKLIPKGTPLRANVGRMVRLPRTGRSFYEDISHNLASNSVASEAFNPSKLYGMRPRFLGTYRSNATSADALQYLYQRNATPAQKGYFKRLPFTQDMSIMGSSNSYSPMGMINLVPEEYSGLHTIGHELGHAKYMTRRLPRSINEYTALSNDRKQFLLNNRMTKRFNTLAPHATEFLHEVGANQQYYKVMRNALSGNKPLFERWQRNMEMANLPALATYMHGNQLGLGTAMSKLPRSLQPAAREYLSRYEQFMHQVRQYASRKGIPVNDALGRVVKLYGRKAQMMDPNLSRDIYNYTVQRGMPVNPNAWYNNPTWR